jgi:hypothetical protein
MQLKLSPAPGCPECDGSSSTNFRSFHATVSARKPNKRPSPITGGWLPENPRDRLLWLDRFIKKHKKKRRRTPNRDRAYHPCIQNLKKLIENSAQLSMLFREMFEEIPYSQRYDSLGHRYNVRQASLTLPERML